MADFLTSEDAVSYLINLLVFNIRRKKNPFIIGITAGNELLAGGLFKETEKERNCGNC